MQILSLVIHDFKAWGGIALIGHVSCLVEYRSFKRVGITRSLQQLGASLNCSTTRDHMFYQVEATRDNLEAAFEQLSSVVSSPMYKTWEVSDNSKVTTLDLGMLEQMPEARKWACTKFYIG